MTDQPALGPPPTVTAVDPVAPGRPLCSVVLTTYARPELLREAVASVLAQTVTDFELLVVDDGSEPPAEIPADPRIRLLRHPTNRGLAAARNTGWDAARGDCVTFLDDDDLYTPDRLEIALAGLARAPIAVCWRRYLDAEPGQNPKLEGLVGDTILDHTTPGMGTIAVRRDLDVRFDERWRAVEDLDWLLRATAHHPVTTVPRVGYLIRRHEGPRPHNGPDVRVGENLELLRAHAAYFATHRRAAAFRLKRAGLLALQVGDRATARRVFGRSLVRRPLPTTTWHLVRSVLPLPFGPRRLRRP